jgi:hypothetical protein
MTFYRTGCSRPENREYIGAGRRRVTGLGIRGGRALGGGRGVGWRRGRGVRDGLRWSGYGAGLAGDGVGASGMD